MHDVFKKVPKAALIFALICFLLPFVTFSCEGRKMARLNGFQLVIGTSIQQPQMFGAPETRKVPPEPLAIVVFLSVIAGLGLSFTKGRKGMYGPLCSAGIGFVCLLFLQSKIENDALSQSAGVIQVQYGAGFYLILLLLLATVAAGVATRFLPEGKPLFKGGGGADRFCAQCGARNMISDSFCKECGAKFA